MTEHVVLKFDSNENHNVTSEIMVEWTSGKSTGKSSWIKRTDVKEGRIAIGDKVKVIWGKSKKLYEAVVANAEYFIAHHSSATIEQ